MSRKDNIKVVERFVDEFWNGKNLDVADELFAPNATTPSTPELPPGPEGAKFVGRMFFAAFPDFKMQIDKVVATDDRVGFRSIQTGTQQGDFFGAPASGREATWTEMTVVRFENGKIVESWWETDMMTLMQQIAAMPSPGADGGGE
jgi:predicted SnoaL-like aldol condensation-catalyzing enzyme